MLGHLELGVFFEIAVFAGDGDRFRIIRNTFGNDLLIFCPLVLVAFARNQELFILGAGVAGDELLQRREQLNEAGEQRFLGEFLKALVEQKAISEVAGGLCIGRRKQVGD